MELALVPHIIRKDLRHLWPLFALWFFLLLGQAALIGSGFSSGSGALVWQIVYTVLTIGLPLLQAVVIVVLVPLLTQDEALVGTTAFWFTRPISRETLLAAKATFITAFLVLPPLVIQGLVFAANGIRPADILRAIPEVLYGSLALILPIAALAVINRTFAKFALWLVASWMVMMVSATLLQLTRMAFSPDNFLSAAQNPSALVSASIVSGLVSLLGCGTVIIHQYLTRRTHRSMLGLVTTVVLMVLIQAAWPYDFLKPVTPPVNAEAFTPGSATMSLKKGSVSASNTVSIGFGREQSTDVRATMAFANVPPGYQLEVVSVQSTWTAPGQEPIRSEKSATLGYERAMWPGPLSDILDGIPVVNGNAPALELYTTLLTLKTADFLKWKAQPGTLQAKVSLLAKKLEVIGRVPLRAGQRIDEGSSHYEISQVLDQTDGVRLIIRERRLNLWNTRSFNQFEAMNFKAPNYVLVNRSRREAVLPETGFDVDIASTVLQSSSILVNRSVPLQFTGLKGDRPVVRLNADWLAGAELVRFEAKPAGGLQRELTAADFLLSPSK